MRRAEHNRWIRIRTHELIPRLHCDRSVVYAPTSRCCKQQPYTHSKVGDLCVIKGIIFSLRPLRWRVICCTKYIVSTDGTNGSMRGQLGFNGLSLTTLN